MPETVDEDQIYIFIISHSIALRSWLNRAASAASASGNTGCSLSCFLLLLVVYEVS